MHAQKCLNWARLVNLQLQSLGSGVKVINLTADEVKAFVAAHPKFLEVRVAEVDTLSCVVLTVCGCLCENSNLNLKLEKTDRERERDKERNCNFEFDCITLYTFSVISLAGAPWCECAGVCAWYRGMFLACCHLVQSCIVVMWDVVNIVMMKRPTPRNSSWTTYLVKIKYLHLVPKSVYSGKLIISVCVYFL